MLNYEIKEKYPNLNYDTNYGVKKEKTTYDCKDHGELSCSIDVAMVKTDSGYVHTELEKPFCHVCKSIEDDRLWEEKQKREHEERRLLRIEKERRQRLDNMGHSARFWNASFDNYTATTAKQIAALEACKTFAENFKDMSKTKGGLLMLGNVGTGKTHLSIAIGRELLKQDLAVKYLTIGKMIRIIRNSWNDREVSEQELYYKIAEFELLIIDEIGVQNCTENEKNILFEVVNTRYEEQKPTILISNLNPADITNIVGQRVIDRIAEGGGNRIVFDWDSHRQRAA
tara:strand:- start:3146 stop:4000 length:855 start_codon:yes stop_codon:yes gene_type:complete